MEPVTLILAALAAGVSAGVTDTASTAIGDAYQGLKKALKKRFAGHQTAETVLEEYTKDPETYEKPLAKQLTEQGLIDDDEILALAQKVLDSGGATELKGTKYSVDARGARNVQTGDRNTQTNY